MGALENLLKKLPKIPTDKIDHGLLGLAIGLVLGFNPPLAFTAVVAVALGKEGYDYYQRKYKGGSNSVEALDAVATMVGGVIGVLAIEGLKVLAVN